jgi:fucose permease
VIQSTAPPFPVLCIGYFFNGIGLALQNAQANGYVAALQESMATKMGFLHAAYGETDFLKNPSSNL